MNNLATIDTQRFARNLALLEIGLSGQKKIGEAKVLIIGVGGLGSPAALYLAASGVGTLGLIDGDTVDISNLQRQVLHFTPDIGFPKTESASIKLSSLNPSVRLNTYQENFDDKNGPDLVGNYDIVIDASDNLKTKLLVNKICVARQVPLVHAGIFQFQGQIMTVLPGKTACYQCVCNCLKDDSVDLDPVAGPLGPVAGIIGTMQALECLKYIVGITTLLTNAILLINFTTMDFHKISISPNPDCTACGRLQ